MNEPTPTFDKPDFTRTHGCPMIACDAGAATTGAPTIRTNQMHHRNIADIRRTWAGQAQLKSVPYREEEITLSVKAA